MIEKLATDLAVLDIKEELKKLDKFEMDEEVKHVAKLDAAAILYFYMEYPSIAKFLNKCLRFTVDRSDTQLLAVAADMISMQ